MPDTADHPTRRGLLIILSSPSGAGKSTLSRRLMAEDPEVSFSISATTRAPRPGEQDGREYHFKSDAEFDDLIATGGMLEHATIFGNRYGSPLAPVEQAVADGRDLLFDVDWQGGQQIRNSPIGAAAVSIFILPPSIAALETRLNARNQDAPDTIARRMSEARSEISHWAEYDYVLINDDLERCAEQLFGIIASERLRRERQVHLAARVAALNTEFEEMRK
ncbi:MAG: guanylate kinase [Pseudomonadota bacterium]